MSGVYIPGAFKKKKEEDNLVESGVVPKPVAHENDKWKDRTTFASLIQGAELKPEEKNNQDVEKVPIKIISLPPYKNVLYEKRFRRFVHTYKEELEEMYENVISYDDNFFDKLREDKAGFSKFVRFVFSVI